METLTIEELGDALAFYLQDHPAGEFRLPTPASHLAVLLGEMIWTKQTSIPWNSLSTDTAHLIRHVLQLRLQKSLDLPVEIRV